MAAGVRFAPSPTGTFHVGNLRTAWISHWWARKRGEPWVVRFEDIDRLRVVAGAQDAQLADLRELGLTPDEIIVQSTHHARFEALFERARSEGMVYPCYCSRKEILEGLASAPHGPEAVYTGRCRTSPEKLTPPVGYTNPTIAWRFRNTDPTGAQDFIIARTNTAGHEFQAAYHWACAIDDHDGNYALLVRAWDLATAATSQRAIFEWVAKTEATTRIYPPIYHTALVTQDDGHRLEKRTQGVTLAELKAKGITPERLIGYFEKSFAERDAGSEKKREIKLSEFLGG